MNEDERMAYRSLLACALNWRDFNGHIITDPLRSDILKALGLGHAQGNCRFCDDFKEIHCANFCGICGKYLRFDK